MIIDIMTGIARAWQPWSKEEDAELEKEIRNKNPLSQIVKSHERSTGAIRCRKLKIAAEKIHEEHYDLSEAVKIMDILEGDLVRYMKKTHNTTKPQDVECPKSSNENRATAFDVQTNGNDSSDIIPHESYEMPEDIRVTLKEIEEKLSRLEQDAEARNFFQCSFKISLERWANLAIPIIQYDVKIFSRVIRWPAQIWPNIREVIFHPLESMASFCAFVRSGFDEITEN